MEEKIPLLKRADSFLFLKIDEFRKTPTYGKILETYAGLEDEQQKIAKWVLIALTIALPFLLVCIMWLSNSNFESDVDNRIALVERMQRIISDNGDIGGLASSVASPVSINSDSDLTGRLSSALSSSGIDLGKMRVSNFSAESVTPTLNRAEADFRFDGLTTEQLVSVFTSLIQSERFRISAVSITRNSKSNLLDGTFHGVHFGEVQPLEEE
jgi:hypothetical protein